MDCTAAGRPENAFLAQQGHCFGPMDCMLSQALRLLLLLALLAQLYLQGYTRVVLVSYRVPPSGKRVVPVARQKWQR